MRSIVLLSPVTVATSRSNMKPGFSPAAWKRDWPSWHASTKARLGLGAVGRQVVVGGRGDHAGARREQSADVLGVGLDGVRLAGGVHDDVGAQSRRSPPCPWSPARRWWGAARTSVTSVQPVFCRVVHQHADQLKIRILNQAPAMRRDRRRRSPTAPPELPIERSWLRFRARRLLSPTQPTPCRFSTTKVYVERDRYRREEPSRGRAGSRRRPRSEHPGRAGEVQRGHGRRRRRVAVPAARELRAQSPVHAGWPEMGMIGNSGTDRRRSPRTPSTRSRRSSPTTSPSARGATRTSCGRCRVRPSWRCRNPNTRSIASCMNSRSRARR